MPLQPHAFEPDGASRFLADAMLGRLARWLRVLSFDTFFDPALDDPALVDLAQDEGRLLLTRDRRLVRDLRPAQALLITVDDPLQQLRQVVSGWPVPPPRELFTRCMMCNTPLRAATAEEQRQLVPARSRALSGPFRRCPQCCRLYWPGSHTKRMRAVLSTTLPEWFGAGLGRDAEGF